MFSCASLSLGSKEAIELILDFRERVYHTFASGVRHYSQEAKVRVEHQLVAKS
jgi:hypothetical protein